MVKQSLYLPSVEEVSSVKLISHMAVASSSRVSLDWPSASDCIKLVLPLD